MAEPSCYESCCTKAELKERLLIEGSDYDSQLDDAVCEAELYVYDRVRPYIGDSDSVYGDAKWQFSTIPPTYTPEELCVIICDIAAAIFLRRHMPDKFDVGWWLQGLKKLDDFIKANFHQGNVSFSSYGEE